MKKKFWLLTNINILYCLVFDESVEHFQITFPSSKPLWIHSIFVNFKAILSPRPPLNLNKISTTLSDLHPVPNVDPAEASTSIKKAHRTRKWNRLCIYVKHIFCNSRLNELFCTRGSVRFWTLKQINDIYKYKNTTLWCMNNALLHVCISIIQTNHYIYSIIFIMNYSPTRSARWQTSRCAIGCEWKLPVW